MDKRQLDYFLKVAERGSITAAAAELNITQPSLTKAMRLLEAELGAVLFHRLPRGVDLTPAGAALARHAALVQVQLRDALAEVRSLAAGDDGHVAIGAGPAWLRRLLPSAVARMQAARPGIVVDVVGGFDEALYRALRAGELDLVVAELPEAESAADLAQIPLSRDDFVVACRRGHPLDGRPGLGLADLLAYPWVVPRGNTRARRRMQALFTMQNLAVPQPAVSSSSISFMLASLRYSDALTYTTRNTPSPEERAHLTFLAVEGVIGMREAGAVHRAGAVLSPAARLVVEELRRLCEVDMRN